MARDPPAPPASPEVDPTHLSDPKGLAQRNTVSASPVQAGVDSGAEPTVRVTPITALGRYEVRRELGRGGMGRVLVAFDTRLGREVAIKELLNPTPEARERFEREVLVTARLQHPSIVTVHEATQGGAGEPYYVMPQIPGNPLSSAIDQTRTLEDRLALLPHVIAACEAMAYAHQHGVIHRDLKPANILVGSFGETVVIDWGLAKVLEPRISSPLVSLEDAPGQTRTGAVMGTPSYMSPEQVRGKAVDARCDVYALGAILWHLFTGAPPYGDGSLVKIMDALTAGPPPEPVWGGTPRDLISIIRSATARDPDRRCASAGQLVAELRRFQRGQRVEAHRYSRSELIARWLNRHRALVAVIALTAAAVMAIGAVSLVRVLAAGRVAEKARDDAQTLQRRAEEERQRALLQQARGQVDADPTGTLKLLSGLSPELSGWDEARFIAEEAVNQDPARWSLHLPGRSALLPLHDGFRAAIGTSGGQIWLWDLRPGALHHLGDQDSPVVALFASPDDRRLISLGDDGRAWLWSVDSGEVQLVGAPGDPVNQVAFFSDGTAGLLRDSMVLELWGLDPVERKEQLTGLDGARVADSGRTVLVRRGGLATLVRGLHDRSDFALPVEWTNPVVSPDSTQVMASNVARGLALIDTSNGKVTPLEGLQRDPSYLAHGFLSSGAPISLVDRRRFNTWRLGSAEPVQGSLDCDAVEIRPLSGSRVMFACDDALEIIDLSSGQRQMVPLHGASASTTSPNGELILGRGDAESVWVWSLRDREDRELALDEPVDYILTGDAADSAVVFGGGRPSTLFALDTVLRTARPLVKVPAGLALSAVSPDGKRVAWSELGTDEVSWLALGGGEVQRLRAPGVQSVDFSVDSRTLVACTSRGAVLVDVIGGKARSLPDAGDLRYAGVLPGSKAVVAVDALEHRLRVWSLDGKPPRELQGLGEGFTSLTRDGRWLVNGHRAGGVEVWSTQDWTLRTLNTGARRVTAFTVLPDGSAALAAAADGALWLVPLDGSKPRAVAALPSSAYSLQASSDSRRVASIDRLGLVTIVSLTSGMDHASGATWQLHDARGPFDSTSYSSRPPQWLTARDNRIRFWSDDLPAEPRALLDRIRNIPQVIEPPRP